MKHRVLLCFFQRSCCDMSLLSPVLSFTSKSTPRSPRPPIFLISYHFLSIHVPTLIFLFPLFHFCSPLLIRFCLTLSYYHVIDTHVDLFPHSLVSCVDSTSYSFDCSSPQTPISISTLPPYPEHLLYLKHASSLIQINLIIAFLLLSAFSSFYFLCPKL